MTNVDHEANKADLNERLCRSLAFHLVESELTASMMSDAEPLADEIVKARALIAEAGYDIDELYPVIDRPVAVAMDSADESPTNDDGSGRLQ